MAGRHHHTVPAGARFEPGGAHGLEEAIGDRPVCVIAVWGVNMDNQGWPCVCGGRQASRIDMVEDAPVALPCNGVDGQPVALRVRPGASAAHFLFMFKKGGGRLMVGFCVQMWHSNITNDVLS